MKNICISVPVRGTISMIIEAENIESALDKFIDNKDNLNLEQFIDYFDFEYDNALIYETNYKLKKEN